ncbi:hypothetical protein GW819_01085 [Candidatus Gracilibacteria bacterium]|nr:hypothetical protein [Candidatus Gracilibacteria bacterium]OIO75924.1 MAG: hypothetical protein AUJ87_03915 [Candidatus Gracilibacteria bacterium CG1_02_38_174]PIQ11754.1 MAG: hypothetical protein COW68_01885 [Candidatus Gracilibacteria bacterium CG18_big_fil_WC_8_21_14_2_50_38_16]PIQ42122.1 MAG: hypothetical protein COW06_00670 [Candidatus Gracilibacteria bacterium CG12_big_fil_rev_8_21_14_0_65_38_15]PIZ01388.1 MAG: hypothetical protein COY60_03725 [Candidatus Gracilibacteria bacterium CG_4
MKLTNNLYSRLSLITCITIVTGYAFVYAWTNFTLTDAETGKPLTSTLMQAVMNNINELNGRFGTLTAGQWCTSDGTKVNCTTNAPLEGVGVNQTWQDMTSSRVVGTIYTNTTDKPIMVYASFHVWGVNSEFITCNGGWSRNRCWE